MVKIRDYLAPGVVTADLQGRTKEEVIRELVDLLHSGGKLRKPEVAFQALMERESKCSTAIGSEIALPHAKCAEVETIAMGLGISHHGIDFNALDSLPVFIVFLMVVPQDTPGVHIRLMARITRMLSDAELRAQLRQAQSAEELLKLLEAAEGNE